jgi:hypothetical protein
MPESTCATCRFYMEPQQTCRRHAPRPSAPASGGWEPPAVSPTYWCGEWSGNARFRDALESARFNAANDLLIIRSTLPPEPHARRRDRSALDSTRETIERCLRRYGWDPQTDSLPAVLDYIRRMPDA